MRLVDAIFRASLQRSLLVARHTAGVPIPSQKLALVFQLLRKGGIQSTIPHALRSTTQVSGHDFSVFA
jgi:hypothetical protein